MVVNGKIEKEGRRAMQWMKAAKYESVSDGGFIRHGSEGEQKERLYLWVLHRLIFYVFLRQS